MVVVVPQNSSVRFSAAVAFIRADGWGNFVLKDPVNLVFASAPDAHAEGASFEYWWYAGCPVTKLPAEASSFPCLFAHHEAWLALCGGSRSDPTSLSRAVHLMISSGSSMHGLLLQYVLHLADIRSNRG